MNIGKIIIQILVAGAASYAIDKAIEFARREERRIKPDYQMIRIPPEVKP